MAKVEFGGRGDPLLTSLRLVNRPQVDPDPRFHPDRRVALAIFAGVGIGAGLTALGLAGCDLRRPSPTPSETGRPCYEVIGESFVAITPPEIPVWLGASGPERQNNLWRGLQQLFLVWRVTHNFPPDTNFTFNIERFYDRKTTSAEAAQTEVDRFVHIGKERLGELGVVQDTDRPNVANENTDGPTGMLINFYALGDCPTPPALEA